MTAARRRGWREAGLVAASLAAVLAASEGVARLLWRDDAFAPRPVPPEWRDLPNLDGMFAMARPNARGLVAGALFETNSAGFRGRERSLEKPPGVFRVAVFGDSIAMGSGVTEEETYAFRLEGALATARPGGRFEVLNFGVGGLDARHAVERLVRLGLRYDPDLIVYGYTLNDVEGPAYRHSVEFERIDPRRFAQAPLALWRLLGPRVDSLRELLFAPRGSYSFELDENYFRNPEAWQQVLAALDRLARVARERGICAVVLVHTRLYWLSALHPYRRHYAAVTRAAEERGLVAIESFPAHRGLEARSLWVAPLDPHPNARGHAVLLEALVEGLDRLPEACWHGAGRRPRRPRRRPSRSETRPGAAPSRRASRRARRARPRDAGCRTPTRSRHRARARRRGRRPTR
jgi:lysophospholipase L1-like esterase